MSYAKRQAHLEAHQHKFIPDGRLDGWRDALALHIDANRAKPFVWGQRETGHDCWLWATSASAVVWGIDPGLEVVGAYSDYRGAVKTLKGVYGVASVPGLCHKFYGKKRHVAEARAGDLVTKLSGERGAFEYAVGVCFGRYSFFVGSEGSGEGLIGLPTLDLDGCYHAPLKVK